MRANETVQQIAGDLGVSDTTIDSWIKGYGIGGKRPGRPYKDIDWGQFKRYQEQLRPQRHCKRDGGRQTRFAEYCTAAAAAPNSARSERPERRRHRALQGDRAGFGSAQFFRLLPKPPLQSGRQSKTTVGFQPGLTDLAMPDPIAPLAQFIAASTGTPTDVGTPKPEPDKPPPPPPLVLPPPRPAQRCGAPAGHLLPPGALEYPTQAGWKVDLAAASASVG